MGEGDPQRHEARAKYWSTCPPRRSRRRHQPQRFIATRESVSASEAGDATAVEMVDFEFNPDAISTDGRVLVHNSDPFAHDFTIDALDVST